MLGTESARENEPKKRLKIRVIEIRNKNSIFYKIKRYADSPACDRSVKGLDLDH